MLSYATNTQCAHSPSQFAGSRAVFDGIEFYLPQLAHMIIHLEVEWDDAILERFALVIAQQSLHFALQFNWILQGALQDYQPQLDDGSPNPSYNPKFYTRCRKLLQNVERCVVYGRTRTVQLWRLYETGQISKKELVLMEQADRRFNALQITEEESTTALHLEGWLDVQLEKGSPPTHRYCELEPQVLALFKAKQCSTKLVPDRAFSLTNAGVTLVPKNKVQVKTASHTIVLHCSSAEEASLWQRRIQEEAQESNLFHNDAQLRADLSTAQKDRYEFFHNEREFVSSLTQVAEDLRELDREQRKAAAPGAVAALTLGDRVYLPLCNSSDLWRRVAQTLPQETRVFNTKERCPVVMHFITRRGEVAATTSKRMDPTVDIAEYMHRFLEVAEEMEQVVEEQEEQEDELKASEHGGSNISNVWVEEDEEPSTPVNATATTRKVNRRVQRLMKESVALPAMLAKRLKPQKGDFKSRRSIVDRQTELKPLVPILEGPRAGDDNASVGENSVVSVERSSVLFKDTILLGDLEEGDIDRACIERAKQYVSGGESWAEKTSRMLQSSRKEDGDADQIEVMSCLSKSNDDLRQEVFVMQMIHYYKSVFASAKLPLWLKTYRILSTDSSTGLLELITDATSLDGLKKSEGYPTEGGLRAYFERVYGPPKSKAFLCAQRNFIQSLAAYGLVSYLLGLKDRHNGNIMIDTRGHLIFIDFGFAMGMAPGHEFSMERAPFKLTKEYIELMGGINSACYKEFESLFVEGFLEARRNSQIALGLVEIMMYKSNYPCFSGWRYGHGKALAGFEKRLMLRVPDSQIKSRARRLVRRAKQHVGTYLYDAFQKASNGYAM